MFLKGIIVNLKQIFSLLNTSQKKHSILLLISILVNGFFDVLGLASILPVVTIALDPSIIETNPYLYKVNIFIGSPDKKYFLLIIFLAVFLIFLLRAIVFLLIQRYQAKYSFKLSSTISKNLFKAYLKKNLDFYNNFHSAKIIRNITAIPQQFSNYVLLPTITIVSETIVFIIIVGIILAYDPIIFLLLVVLIFPVLFYFYNKTKNSIQQNGKIKNKMIPILHKDVYQAIRGFVDVKLASKERYFIESYNKKQIFLNNINVRMTFLKSIPAKLVELSAIGGVVLMIIYATFLSDDSIALISLIGIYVAAAYRLMPSVNKIMSSVMLIKEYQMVFEILKDAVNVSDFVDNPKQIEFEKYICLKNISFCYPGVESKTLVNTNLFVKKGEKIGFIGKSGSGKTTLMNLLLRFYIEQSGDLLVDGVKIDSENISGWRKLMGYVQQNIFIIDGTIAENIAFGLAKEDIDMVKLHNSINQSSLSEVVERLPQGLNTIVGEHGVKISGGQRQRIAIARALYNDAEILIFDEATSALDNETEEEIIEAIKNISKSSKTIFIIAHRYTSLKYCDRIFEMSQGNIIKEVKYKDLIEEIKLYGDINIKNS
jgi:ATP-binding cassette, subfamily B, bacterial PglK